MPAKPKHIDEKSPASPLELHILSLLDRGARTPYDFLQAGVSLGSAIPALRRMEAAGWVRANRSAEVGKRQRHSFSLSVKGHKLLVRAGISLLQQPAPSDFDSVLRVVDIGQGAGAPSEDIELFLNGAARDRLALAKQVISPMTGSDQLDFKIVRAQWDVVRLKAEARFLSRTAKSVTSGNPKG